MRAIRKLSDDMKENIKEARCKIHIAYELKNTYPALAAWYKDMALAHLNFNDAGHQIGTKMISDYKISDAYKADPSYADAMIPVWDAEHADMVEDTAEVRQQINSFK